MTYSPFEIIGNDRPGRWLITCDHASNHVPDTVNDGDLGLPPEQMARHIAYDIGAAGVARALGEMLDSPVILTHFSRLVIDPNRGLDDPTLLMKLYDGTIIPGNRRADATERARRVAEFWVPYHDAYETLAARAGTVICAVHSFTPRLAGRTPRPWEIGVLSSFDRRLADPLLARLRSDLVTPVGDNEPYGGHLPGDAVDQHALRHGRLNVLLELRQDLITTEDGQVAWAARLAPHLEAALAETGL